MTLRSFVDITPDYIPSELVVFDHTIANDFHVMIDRISKYEYFAVFFINTKNGPEILLGQNYIFDTPNAFLLEAEADVTLHENLRLKAVCFE